MKKPVYQIFLHAHIAQHDERQKEIKELGIAPKHFNHSPALNPENRAFRNSDGRGGAQRTAFSNALFAQKVAYAHQCNGGLFAFSRNGGELDPAFEHIKDTICRHGLEEERIFLAQAMDRAAYAGFSEASDRVRMPRRQTFYLRQTGD